MFPNGWIKVAVTDWMDDSDEKFSTSRGEMTSLEWLQTEMSRIAKDAPFSRPFIRCHPKYFDKDSHSRRRHKQIALYRFISPVEFLEERGGFEVAAAFIPGDAFFASEPDAFAADRIVS